MMHIERLQRAFLRSDLALFLGAGVSMSAQAPSWTELLRRLTYAMLVEEAGVLQEEIDLDEMRELFSHFRRRSPLILARFLRHYFGDRFRDVVRDVLYQGIPADGTSPLLEEIARLATPPRTGTGLSSIVNYNFDDLLEKAISRRQIHYRVIVGPGARFDPNALPIFHVQGYLPREDADHPVTGSPGDLIFSEEAYHSQYLNPYGWSNLVQLHQLRDHTGLFVGMSLTDPNLRRLLEVVHEQDPEHVHYAILPTPQAEAKSDPDSYERLNRTPLMNALLNLENRVASSLGIQLIWIDSYDKIAEVLSQIR